MKLELSTSALRRSSMVVAALAMAGVMTSAHAANLVTNGSFENNGGNGQLGYNTSAAGWSVPALNGSYAFLYAPGTADTIGADGEYGNVAMWGPGNGVANGMPATSPDGGYFVALDGAFQQGAISQTISGLTSGATYTVSFDWAGAQQTCCTGPTSEQFQVSFGSSTQSTGISSIGSQGFTGWQTESFTFTADGTSDLLSFLAVGTPGSSEPPFSLLDGVSVTATPEPSSVALLLTGFGAIGGIVRRRFKK